MKHPQAPPQRVLVTGYGGFLGSEIVRQLLERGHEVVGLGRRDYPHLESLSIRRVRGDVRDGASVREAAAGVDAVIHTAAIAGIWGPWRRYYEINALGTRHVIEACHEHAIPTLVYCSSPSVTFSGRAQSGVDETEPYPSRWLCHYSHSKALGEQWVLAAHEPGRLHTLALRPHLIWGADDPHLFPRLIERARRGRLRQIGDGTNRIDTVHVRNAALAHVLGLDALVAERQAGLSKSDAGLSAAEAGASALNAGGRAYFITQDEPVDCWAWMAEILAIAGVKMPSGRVSFKAAWRIGHVLEWIYRCTGRQSEPPMTRFLAAQLAKDHYFDISAARTRLGYEPQLSMQAGLDELRRAWQR